MSRFGFGATIVLSLVALALFVALGVEAFDRLVGCAADPASCEVRR